MALKPPRTQRARMVGYISHDAGVRVEQRVKEILARREAAVERARRAAARLKSR
jgi:ribosomal protein L15E